ANATAASHQPASAAFTVVPAPARTFLSVGNVSGGPLSTVAVPMLLSNVTDLGALTVNLTFDPAVVQLVGVGPGNLTGASLTWNVNNSTGSLGLLVTLSDVPGASGTFEVVVLTFSAVGPAGARSALDLTTTEAVHSDGSAFLVADVDGTFRSGLLGDVTNDGLVDAADVTALSEFVVGLRGPGGLTLANADANGDEQVTGADAMFLSQFVAGTRAAL
ncbi:MAG TPA: dockerin type I domain-containing protein, partial [Candidatus Thermoplasmatota archaeon]|nr:dockerin type I domain-containing protein [Candidatus Thermoplasmatota archaeon]